MRDIIAPSRGTSELNHAWEAAAEQRGARLMHGCHPSNVAESSAARPEMNPTLLIVDDEKHTRDGLRASLEESFDVYVAADSQGALNVLEGETVELMLTDLRLGGEDGMQLIDKVLALPHPPIVIMMTAY